MVRYLVVASVCLGAFGFSHAAASPHTSAAFFDNYPVPPPELGDVKGYLFLGGNPLDPLLYQTPLFRSLDPLRLGMLVSNPYAAFYYFPPDWYSPARYVRGVSPYNLRYMNRFSNPRRGTPGYAYLKRWEAPSPGSETWRYLNRYSVSPQGSYNYSYLNRFANPKPGSSDYSYLNRWADKIPGTQDYAYKQRWLNPRRGSEEFSYQNRFARPPAGTGSYDYLHRWVAPPPGSADYEYQNRWSEPAAPANGNGDNGYDKKTGYVDPIPPGHGIEPPYYYNGYYNGMDYGSVQRWYWLNDSDKWFADQHYSVSVSQNPDITPAAAAVQVVSVPVHDLTEAAVAAPGTALIY